MAPKVNFHVGTASFCPPLLCSIVPIVVAKLKIGPMYVSTKKVVISQNENSTSHYLLALFGNESSCQGSV